MRNTTMFIKILSLMFLLAWLPLSAEAGFFSSDTVASYKGADLDQDELLPVVALLNAAEKSTLRKDKEKLELFIRKEVIRKYLIAQAHKTDLDDEPLRALQMQLTGEHELYRLYILEQNTVPNGYPQEALLKQIYEQNIQQFKTAAQVHLRQIFLPVNEKNSLKRQLNEVRFMLSQIKNGKKTFVTYAKSHSKHKESAAKGGDLGWLSRDTLLPQVAAAIDGMSGKQRLKITQSSTSVRLIELLETRQPGVIPLANVRQALIDKLHVQKQNELNQAYLAGLLKKNPVSIKDFKLLRKAIDSRQRDTFKASGSSIIATMGAVKLDLNYYLKQLNILESVQHITAANMDDAFVREQLIGSALLKQFVITNAKKAEFDQRENIALRMQRASEDVLVQAMLKSMAALPASFPSDKQLLDAYNQNRTKFTHPDMIHMGQIFIASTKDSERNKKLSKAMADLHTLLSEKPAMFASLAKKYSQNTASKNSGGDMGWLKFETLLPAFKDAVKQLKPDTITSVIKTEQGWHIVKYFAFRKAGVSPVAEVKSKLKKALRETEKKQRIQRKTQALISSKLISIDSGEKETLAKSI